jgi:hypothetical protein
VADALPLPEGLALDPVAWEQTPLVVPHVVVPLLALSQQQTARLQVLEARLADLEARLPPRSHHADRPPSGDPPYAPRPTRAGPPGKPGAKPGPPGHQHARWPPTEGTEVRPSACAGGQPEGLDTSPDAPPQVIERPAIQMLGRQCVWYEACGPPCGQVTHAQVPPEAAAARCRSSARRSWGATSAGEASKARSIGARKRS